LFLGDQEIPFSFDSHGRRYFALSPAQATYRLNVVAQDRFTGRHFAKTVTTDWTFTSGHPVAPTVTRPYYCVLAVFAGYDPTCSWLPLIYLGYRLDLGLDNTASAGRAHRVTVTAQPGPPSGAPPIAGLRVWASYDGGANWVRAPVSAIHKGEYSVVFKHPPLDRTDGAVSIKAEAWDSAGNRVTQTLPDAYGLSPGP
jgi:hypothetical protein